MLNDELRTRGHSSRITTTWSIDLPHRRDYFPKADIVYVATPVLFNGSAFELANRLVTLEAWDRELTVINPLSSLLKATKAYFTNYCSAFGIPHPKTLVTENLENALNFALSSFNHDRKIVIKPVARGEGFGVHLLQPMDSETVLRYLLWYSSEYGDRVFYLQEFVENFGYDIRLFVIDGKIVGRMKRSRFGDFRFNIAQGGVSEVFQGAEYDALALKSVEVMGAKIAGVDVMPTKEGSVVLEVNVHPGFKGLTQITGILIPKLLVDYFESLK